MRIPFAFRSLFPANAVVAFALALTTTNPHPAMASDCVPTKPATFTVSLPKLNAVPASENSEGWDLPEVWGVHDDDATSDSITVPNGRPIYALIISGYAINSHFDELLVYNFARHLMDKGAYVHWAWWNNLLNPYLGGPLHFDQSDPGTAADLGSFLTPADAANKAVPADDYQFIADAKLFLSAIRANNPEAIIVIVGHSMGGAACARLADQVSSSVVIDLAAPIDPVGNRNYPWAGPTLNDESFYNWTRWRATRGTFLGFKAEHWTVFLPPPFPPPPPACVAVDPWFATYAEAQFFTDILLGCNVHVHGASSMSFGSNIINLWHRWQHEAEFPFDYDDDPEFNANPPAGGSDSQDSIAMQSGGSDPGGWPAVNLGGDCCPIGPGVAWPNDGHGEIIGTRGPAVATRPLGTRVRTSSLCNSCPNNDDWPTRTLVLGNWIDSNSNIAARVALMKELETLPFCADSPACTNNPPPTPDDDTWPHRPYNAALCKVSTGLIDRFNTMNKPPVANAGPDQVVQCNGCTSTLVALNGTGSSDTEPGALTYNWTWDGGSATGATPNVTLPYGPTCIKLQVKDPAGHVTLDYVLVTVNYPSGVVPYPNGVALWEKSVEAHQAYAFDDFYPGVANALACLLPNPNRPAVLNLDGGTLTVTASENRTPYCAISDSSTPPAVSDARIANNQSVVSFNFDPPVQGFYTYFGSLAIGETATMKLYGGIGGAPLALVETITSLPSEHNSFSSGLGFTSPTPIARIDFTTTEGSGVLVGAFTTLQDGQQSLGTINIPGYQGPDGSAVQLDFGFAFVDSCPADLNDTGTVDVDDLLTVINAWGLCDGACPPYCEGDVNSTCSVDVDDLLVIINAWGECD